MIPRAAWLSALDKPVLIPSVKFPRIVLKSWPISLMEFDPEEPLAEFVSRPPTTLEKNWPAVLDSALSRPDVRF